MDTPLNPGEMVLPAPIAQQARRTVVIAEAQTWMGTPWHHAARVRGAGVDCGLFLAAVYEAAGLAPHLEPDQYPQDWMLHTSEELLLNQVQAYAREVAAPQPGDIALWQIGRTWSHAAIVLAWPRVIHTLAGCGVMEDDASVTAALVHHPVRFFSPWGDE